MKFKTTDGEERTLRQGGREPITFKGGSYETDDPREAAWLRSLSFIEEDEQAPKSKPAAKKEKEAEKAE